MEGTAFKKLTVEAESEKVREIERGLERMFKLEGKRKMPGNLVEMAYEARNPIRRYDQADVALMMSRLGANSYKFSEPVV